MWLSIDLLIGYFNFRVAAVLFKGRCKRLCVYYHNIYSEVRWKVVKLVEIKAIIYEKRTFLL